MGRNQMDGDLHPEQLYCIWRMMKSRCLNPKDDSYKNYGGRGILVYAGWMKFSGFAAHVLKEIGERPSPEHTIDRIDTMGNYEPGNIRWSTREGQSRNRRNNRYLTAFGETKLVIDWAKEKNIPRVLLIRRLDRGWSAERALLKSRPSSKMYD